MALSLSSTALGQHVTHFELLNYDAAEVERAHARHVRSAPEDGHIVSLDFVSHGRRFRLDLERDNEALREDSISNINLSPITALFIHSVARF